jgi:hypothetical protein
VGDSTQSESRTCSISSGRLNAKQWIYSSAASRSRTIGRLNAKRFADQIERQWSAQGKAVAGRWDAQRKANRGHARSAGEAQRKAVEDMLGKMFRPKP